MKDPSKLPAEFSAAVIRMDELLGVEIAQHYGDPAAEYRAIRTGAALIDRRAQAILTISGPDCKKFLQAYVTNDLLGIEPGEGCLNGVANQMGRAVGDCRTYALEDSILVECDADVRPGLTHHLGKYIPFSKSKFEEVSDSLALLSLQGPQSRELLQAVTGTEIGEMQPQSHRLLTMAGVEARACKISLTGEEGFDLMVPAEHAAEMWQRLVAGSGESGARPAGAEACEEARIEAAIPRFGVDFDENNIFLESGLDDAISYAKGCYLGQEIIARIYFRGHVSKRLATIELDGTSVPVRGDQIFSGEIEAGRVTSACWSPALGKPLAFAMLKHNFLAMGTALEVARGEERVSSRVRRAPFGWERRSVEPKTDSVGRVMPVLH